MKKSCCGSVDGCCHTRDPIVYINEKPNASEKKELCILRSSGQSSKGSQTWSGKAYIPPNVPIVPKFGKCLIIVYLLLFSLLWMGGGGGGIY